SCCCRAKRNPVAVGSPGSLRWGYVLMSRLPGVPLGTVWDQLSAAGWDRLAGQLGEAVGCCTICRPPAIRDWWPADWPAFVAGPRTACRRTVRPELASVVSGSDSAVPRFPDGIGLLSRLPCCRTPRSRASTCWPPGARKGHGGCPA